MDYIDEDGVAHSTSINFLGGDTMQTILDGISGLFADSTASMNADGKIVITSNTSGYSLAQITGMSYDAVGAEALEMPTYFDYATIGSNDSKTFKISVFDNQGQEHVMTGTFVKTDDNNTWDLVVQSVDNERTASWSDYDVNGSSALNRRISGIEFNTDGSYKGLSSSSEVTEFAVQFENNPSVTQTITLDFGTPGEFTGLTQFASQQSSAAALSQNGYEAGSLSSTTIDQTGMIIGTFTNGVKVNIAAMQIGMFQNPGALESVGSGYYLPTANSGVPVETMASIGGAGKIKGKSLEGSNVDMASEFVNLMQAQNGYQANSRTIKVANAVLQELTNLIR